jgi:CTP:molybdopterin cytidylyltransferase MocA
VGCSRELTDELLALPPDSEARVVIHAHLERACYVDVDDPGVLADVDDPEAYRALSGSAPR